MPTRFIMMILIFAIIFLCVDLYTFKGISLVLKSSPLFKIIKYIHWGILPLCLAAMFLFLKLVPYSEGSKSLYGVYIIVGILILFTGAKIVFTIFHLTEDIIYGVSWIVNKISEVIGGRTITLFNSRPQLISKLGIVFLILFFILGIKGMVYNRFNYKITNHKLSFANLPPAFDKLKIVHISDIHIGCFYNNDKKLEKAVQKINALNPDLILFSGDLVINFADEVVEFKDIIKKLNAKYGKYSVLGNHDYGEYYNWESENDKKDNLSRLIRYQEEAGFKLLLNENNTIKVNDDSIAVIGIENWGLPPFPQYGDLSKAIANLDSVPFKILLSHDPTHWDEEVKNKTNIDLTLSGHTHGMQFGIFTKRLKWSPIKMKYKKWGGLFNENGQYLYVNVGLGSIGFPGRIGMRPEITVIEVEKKEESG